VRRIEDGLHAPRQPVGGADQGETFEIVEILVVGVATEAGVQQTVPAVYFAVFKVDEERA
jgi:hypothetical protein